MLQYVQDNIELYVREVVLTNEVLKDNAEDIIDLLRRLDGVTEVQLQIVRQEQFALSNIEDCAKQRKMECCLGRTSNRKYY